MTIPNMPKMNELFDRIRGSDETLTEIRMNSSLKVKIFTQETWCSLCDAIAVNTPLRKLEMAEMLLPDRGMERFAEAIEVNQGLEDLTLYFTEVSAESIKALQRALTINKKVRRLALIQIGIGDTQGHELAELLKADTGLLSFTLMDSSLTSDGAIAIGQGLLANKKIANVCLDTRKEYADLLRRSKKLQNVNFRRHPMASGQDEFEHLAAALRDSTCVEELNYQVFGVKHIKDSKSVALASLLTHNRTLLRLKIEPSPTPIGTLIIAQTLVDVPRRVPLSFKIVPPYFSHDYEDARLVAASLGDLADELGLPAEAKEWGGEEVLRYVQVIHESKLEALVLGLHARAGRDSPFRMLEASEDCLREVCRAYWGC